MVAESMKGVSAYKVATLQEAWDVLIGKSAPRKAKYHVASVRQKTMLRYVPDLKDMRGVALAKEAMKVAIAGGHNILLAGPPGQGKTMLAKAATGLLPELVRGEMLEVNKVFSASGDLAGIRAI